jgi:hypothetical protein
VIKAVLDVLVIVVLLAHIMRLLLLVIAADANRLFEIVKNVNWNASGTRLVNLVAAVLYWYLLSRFVGWM